MCNKVINSLTELAACVKQSITWTNSKINKMRKVSKKMRKVLKWTKEWYIMKKKRGRGTAYG